MTRMGWGSEARPLSPPPSSGCCSPPSPSSRRVGPWGGSTRRRRRIHSEWGKYAKNMRVPFRTKLINTVHCVHMNSCCGQATAKPFQRLNKFCEMNIVTSLWHLLVGRQLCSAVENRAKNNVSLTAVPAVKIVFLSFDSSQIYAAFQLTNENCFFFLLQFTITNPSKRSHKMHFYCSFGGQG